ncbi:MAG: zf-HC2 domain-containing protein [Acidobacteriota bacterium]|nr:zf-HC2 domain-containing protein [Acidobacteriota bacterium]
MPCEAFEDRLIDYSELGSADVQAVNTHLEHCSECRSFLSALAGIDAALTAAFADHTVSPEFSKRVTHTVLSHPALHRPSLVPEMLDAIGWAAVISILLWLTAFFVPGVEFSTPLAVTIGLLALMGGFAVAYRCYDDLRRC